MTGIKSIAVVGAGTMGHSMAQHFAYWGCPVALQDISEEALQKARDKMEANLETMIQLEGMPGQKKDEALDRIKFITSLEEALQEADCVIENITENLQAKQDLFESMEQLVSPDVILASNTSGLSITDIAQKVKNKERVILAHWFNPPHIVPLVELCRAEGTSRETVDRMRDLLTKCGKVTIDVRQEVPGLVANRLQTALAREAFYLYEQGVASAEDIDNAVMYGPGLRLPAGGFFRIVDLGGLDIWNAVANFLIPAINSDTSSPKILQEKVDKGELGLKSGKGFYEYTDPPEKYTYQRDILLLKLLQLLQKEF